MDTGFYYDEGFEAFWADKEMNECPYKEEDGDRYIQWRAGWFDAYVETK